MSPDSPMQGSAPSDPLSALDAPPIPSTLPGPSFNHAFYQAIFNTVAVGIATCDMDGRFTSINQRGLEILGYSAEEIIGLSSVEITHPEDQAAMVAYLQSLLHDESPPASLQNRYIRKDGRIVWVESFLSPIRDPQGQITGVLGAAIDITERKRAEEAVEDSEERFRRTFDQCPIGAAVVGLDFRFIRVNEALCRITGYTADELTHLSFPDITHPDDTQRDVEQARQLAAGLIDQYVTDKRYIRKDGTIAWVHLSVRLIRSGDDRALCYLPMMEDITERINALEALRRSEARYRRFVETATEGVWAMDADRRTTFVNRRMADMLGYTIDDMLGRPVTDFMFEEDLSSHQARMKLRFQGQDGQYEQAFRTKTGEALWCMVSAKALTDGGGQVQGSFAMFTDITDRKRTEEALQESLLRISLAVEAGKVGLWDWDLATHKVTYSPEWKRQIGYEDDEISDDFGEWKQRVHPEDLEPTLEHINHNIRDASDHYDTEFRFRHKDGSYRWILAQASIIKNSDGRPVRVMGSHVDVTDRKRDEAYRELTLHLLQAMNRPNQQHELLQDITKLMRDWSGCEAVGIRLCDGEDYPYFETRGFPAEFIRQENHLCMVDQHGEIIRDSQGNPVLECMCGNVIQGRFNTSLPFFTEFGSFWTNSTTDLLASTGEVDRQARTRNRCNGEGYESVALIPLRYGDQTFGLLQFNDIRRNRFDKRLIALLERLATNLSIGLAQRQSAKALQESLQTSADLVRAIPSGLYIYQYAEPDELILLSGNPESERLIGVKVQDWIGRSFHEMWPQAKERGITERYLNVMRTGVTHEVDDLEYQDDKIVGAFHIRAFALPGKRLAVAFENVTERLRAERNYQTLFREMHDGFALHEIICDDQGTPIDYRFLAANPAFERQTGLKVNDVIGKTVLDILPGIEHHWIETYGRVALTGEPVSFESYSAELEKHFEVTAFRPAPGQFACIFKDITERELHTRAMQQAQKMQAVGQLAGGVAHNFNNLLLAISSNIEILSDAPQPTGSEPTDTRMHALAQLRQAVDMGTSLTRQLLTFCRQQATHPTLLDPEQVVRNMIEMLSGILGSRTRLEHITSIHLGQIQADPGQLEHAILNLVLNARDAMPHGGTVKIALDRVAGSRSDEFTSSRDPIDYIRIRISDTGVGMDHATRDRLFEPFFTTKSIGQGTGLGLATVYGFVRQAGGRIEVDSEPGQGTTVSLFLPVALGNALDPGNGRPAPADNRRVMICHSDPMLRSLMRQYLEKAGFLGLDCRDALDSMDWSATNADVPDLVIAEWRGRPPGCMKALGPGAVLGKAIRYILIAERPTPGITASAEAALSQIATAGNVRVLYKPFHLPDLLRMVQESLAMTRGA